MRPRAEGDALGAYFNPRSPHGERRALVGAQQLIEVISTHAPRTGSDACPASCRCPPMDFNPRSPHGERRFPGCILRRGKAFQPTLPARGATQNRYQVGDIIQIFQPTLPARGATKQAEEIAEGWNISTHAPRTGSDGRIFKRYPRKENYFNPRSPHGERPQGNRRRVAALDLFQPTLPARGATCKPVDQEFLNLLFQPTLPARGATHE